MIASSSAARRGSTNAIRYGSGLVNGTKVTGVIGPEILLLISISIIISVACMNHPHAG